MKKSNRSAYEAALHLLEYRAQSEYEIRTKLKRRGYEDEDIEKAVEKLYFYHYLNDEELAEEILSITEISSFMEIDTYRER